MLLAIQVLVPVDVRVAVAAVLPDGVAGAVGSDDHVGESLSAAVLSVTFVRGLASLSAAGVN